MAENNELNKINPKSKNRVWLLNLIVLVIVAAAFTFLYFTSQRFHLHIDYIIKVISHGDIEGLKAYVQAWGVWAPIVSALIMVFESIVAPLPGVVITLVNGLLFGVFRGTLLSWGSSMVGAVICFYIARMLGRPAVERLVNKRALSRVDHFFERYGNNSVLIARLLPVVSFHAISYAAGLTPITFWGFFWASAIGELPATIVYSWLGENITDLAKVGLWAFAILAVLLVLGVTIKRALDNRINNRIEKEKNIV